MNLEQELVIATWAGTPFAVNTTIDTLSRMGFRVAVIYEAGGIVVNVTRAGRGQEHSGTDEREVLGELLARMIEAGDVPPVPQLVAPTPVELPESPIPEVMPEKERRGRHNKGD